MHSNMKHFGLLAGNRCAYIIDNRLWMNCTAAANVFTAEECTRIISYWDEAKAFDAKTKSTTDRGNIEGAISSTRVGKIQWLNPDEDEYYWILTRLTQAVIQINEAAYGFLIDGMMDKLQLTRYLPGDKYGWHEDTAIGLQRRRKLSFTLQLTDPKDFEGGGLEFHGGSVAFPGNDLGAIAVFPSFLQHRAREVTSGERWALVGWFSGPEWR